MPHVVCVSLLPQLFPAAGLSIVDAAVVIDTLRFTTTACQALAVGGNSVTVASDVESAKRLAASLADRRAHVEANNRPMLCGERHCRPIAGFDLGNSPYEYTPQTVSGRDLIFTTTNGTRAVSAARQALCVLLGSLVNRTAVASALHTTCQSKRDSSVGIICSGTDGEVAAEDMLAAGAIIDAWQHLDASIVLGNDAAWLSLALWQQCHAADSQAGHGATRISRLFRECLGGKNLMENGYERDLDFSEQTDALNIVPMSQAATFERFALT